MAVSRAACWRPPLGPPRYWLLVRAQMIGGRWRKADRRATARVKFRGSEGRGLKYQRRQGKLFSTKSPSNIVPMELTAYKKVQSSWSGCPSSSSKTKTERFSAGSELPSSLPTTWRPRPIRKRQSQLTTSSPRYQSFWKSQFTASFHYISNFSENFSDIVRR